MSFLRLNMQLQQGFLMPIFLMAFTLSSLLLGSIWYQLAQDARLQQAAATVIEQELIMMNFIDSGFLPFANRSLATGESIDEHQQQVQFNHQLHDNRRLEFLFMNCDYAGVEICGENPEILGIGRLHFFEQASEMVRYVYFFAPLQTQGALNLQRSELLTQL